MFQDRFLYLRLSVVCLLLWGSCVYSKDRGELLYPSYSMCVENPERFAGSELYLRSCRVAEVGDSRFTVEGRWLGRIRVSGRLPPGWKGRIVSLVTRFDASPGGEAPHLRLLTGASGLPEARLERQYRDRRLLMYSSSAAVLLLWMALFRREFRVCVPRSLVEARER